jgi:hypothetical protein
VHNEEDMSDYNEQTLMEAVIKRVAATPDARLRQTVALDAEQRLLLQLGKVPHPLDAEEVAVETDAAGSPAGRRSPTAPCRGRKGVGQRAIDPLGGHEVTQGVEAAYHVARRRVKVS